MNWEIFWHRSLRRPYKLHVIDHAGTGPIIILLHGIAASSDNWFNLIPLLSTQYHCITIDLLGFGRSPKPQWADYTMEDHIRSIDHTIRGLHLRGGYTLIGFSLGSLLATRFARTRPRAVNQVVLLSPPVYSPEAAIVSRAARARNKLLLKLYKFLRTYHRMTPKNFKRLSYILPLPKSVIKNPETWTPFFRTLEQCIENQTITKDIIDIRVPIDVFYGTLDQVIVPYNLRKLRGLNDVSLHVIRGANHDVSRRYAEVVANFLLQAT